MPSSAIDVLRAVFPRLSSESITALYEQARLTEYPDKTILVREGEPGDTLYVIVNGQVEVSKLIDGARHVLDTLGRGQLFGEIALLMDRPRQADIVVQGSVMVLEIDRALFEEHIKAHPETFAEINAHVIDKLLNQENKLIPHLSDRGTTAGPTQVFVSYSRQDQAFVFRLADDLTTQGIDVWLDQRKIEVGTIWSAAIETALEACSAMIVVLSSSSVESPHVADEVHYYLDEGKPIVPVLVDACRVPYRLRRIQHITFVDTPYQDALVRLVDRLRALG
jgi:CRP-like cAMP-binding protein